MGDATIAAGALLLGLGVGVALTLWLTGRRGDGIARVSDTVHRLERLLRASNPRGRYGEQLLEDLLARTLPPDGWEPKHRFRAGQVVDAVVRLPGGLVPIGEWAADAPWHVLAALGTRRDPLTGAFRPPPRRPCAASWAASTLTRWTRPWADGWPPSSHSVPPAGGHRHLPGRIGRSRSMARRCACDMRSHVVSGCVGGGSM